MRAALASYVLLVVACFAAFTADSPAQALFNRLRSKVRADVARAPRYTCVENVTRKRYRPQYGGRPPGCEALIAARDRLTSPGMLVWHDRLRLDVAVGADSEIFSYAGARRFETADPQALALSGSTGSGDFGAFLASVFGADAEGFRFVGEQEVPLGRLAAFEYTVPQRKSHYSYRTGTGENGIVGYRGTFYAVPATAELKRLVVEATDFPSGNVCRVYDTMDYARVNIGSGDFPLPEVSRMTVLYRNGEESQNETHYSDCHEFTGESTIRFDDTDQPNSPSAAKKPELRALPPGTQVRVKIDPPVNSETAAAGDPITGVVEHDVKHNGQAVVRTNDRLHGRVLRLEQFLAPLPRWIVAIRFESIERDGVEQPVTFRPLDDGDRSPPPPQFGRRGMQGAPRGEVPNRPPGAGVFTFASTGNLVLDRRFHSAWEIK
jgi:hypothetical protein